MTVAALPSNRDEDWRYADISAVHRIGAGALDAWREVTVPAGECWTDCMVLDGASPDLQRLRLTLEEGSSAALFALNAGGDFARLEVEVALAESAHFEFGGVTIGGGEAVREFVTRTIHAAPGATSSQVVRAVHWDEATGNFLGRIEVARGAQKTDAAQSFKALLLTKGASANTKPELEIFADEVKCAHGAAIGQMDEGARFYMASRGLPPEAARKLLVRAFIGDAFVALGDEGERERMMDLAVRALGDAV